MNEINNLARPVQDLNIAVQKFNLMRRDLNRARLGKNHVSPMHDGNNFGGSLTTSSKTIGSLLHTL